MSVIKIYTLLNLASDRKIIPTTSLAYDPNLPQEFDENSELVTDVGQRTSSNFNLLDRETVAYEDSENDTDDEDDDEYNGNRNRDSDSSDDELNDDSDESDDEVTVIVDNNDNISW